MNELTKGCTLQHGKYTIVKPLGQGSFGITYLATTKLTMIGKLGQMDTTVNVAIKEFFMSEMNSRSKNGSSIEGSSGSLFSNYRQKFKKEAENLSKLDYPNIVHVLDVFDENNTTYYVMQYIDGQTLDDFILHQKCIKESKAISILKEIGKAVQYMHSNKMLHLDLKPKNVMLDKDGKVYLIDFGLSKQYDSKGEPESSTKVGAGTPGYAPIEQANYREGKDFPVTMDVYALGGTMFKMLTGVRPPEASDILNDGFPLYELQERKISDSISASVARAMAPAKKDRYQTVEDFLNSFEDEETIIDIEKSTRLKSKKVHKNNDLFYYVNQKTSKVEISNFNNIVFGQVLSITENKIEIFSYDRQERKGIIKIDARKYKLFLENLQSLKFILQPEGTKIDPETTGGDWKIAIRLFDENHIVYANYWIAKDCGDCGNILDDIADVNRKLERVLKALVGIDEKIQLNDFLKSSNENKNKKDDEKVVRPEKVKKFLQINPDTSKVRIEFWPYSLFPPHYNGAFIATVTPYEVNPNVSQESTREMIPMTSSKYKKFLNALQTLKLEIREEAVEQFERGSFSPAKLKISLYDKDGFIYNDLWIDGMNGGNIVGNVDAIEKQIIQIVPGLNRYLNGPFYEVPDLIKEQKIKDRLSQSDRNTTPSDSVEQSAFSFRWWAILLFVIELVAAQYMVSLTGTLSFDEVFGIMYISELYKEGLMGEAFIAILLFIFSLSIVSYLWHRKNSISFNIWLTISIFVTLGSFANSLLLPTIWHFYSVEVAGYYLSLGLSIVSSFTFLIKKSA